MKIDYILNNIYWLIIGCLTAIFILITGDIFFVIIPLLVIFSISIFVGNMFAVRTVYNPKSVFIILIGFILIFYFEQVLNLEQIAIPLNVLITSLLSISLIFSVLIKESGGATILMIIQNLKILKDIFINYLWKWKSGAILGFIVEIILIIFLFLNLPSLWVKIPMILFWCISAPLFTLFRGTAYVIKEPLYKIKIIAKIYGTSRLTYFLLPFYLSYQFFPEIHWLTFSYLFSLAYLGFITGLIPYITWSKELEDTIQILKYVSENPKEKVGRITNTLKLEKESYVLDILKRLQFMKYVEQTGNNRWLIRGRFKEII